MKYRVVRRRDLESFEGAISNMLMNGWVPVGGVAIEYVPGTLDLYYVQAMSTEKWEPQK